MRKSCVLAEISNFGRVFDCGDCGNIHVTVGPVGVTLSPDAYMQLVALIHTSASNFEAWIGQNNPGYGQCQEGIHADRDSDPDPA